MQEKIRAAAIQMPIADETDARGNLALGCNLVEQAGTRHPDLVCLPELFTGLNVSSTIPGPETERLGALAKRFGMYIVAPFYVRRPDGLFNCAVLLDREGGVIGSYDKVHLWPWEAPVGGVTPGSGFPVFELDFGTLGLCICHDHEFPETARTLALKGAEVICCATRMPDPFQFPWLELSRVRALENQAYVVSVGCADNDCSTHIVGPNFRAPVIAAVGTGTHIIDAELDLDWLRSERQGSPLDRTPREVPSPEAAERLKEVKSFCYLRDRRPELYTR